MRASRPLTVLVAACAVLAAVAVGVACAPLPADRDPAYLPAVDETVPADGAAFPQLGARVENPWQPGQPELGVQVYWHDNPDDTPELINMKAERVIDYVVGLDANSVSVSFPLFTRTPNANAVTAGPATPSPARLAILLNKIKNADLRVTLRPILDEENLVEIDPMAWRGSIEPVDRNAWFDSYRSVLTPYLNLAEKAQVETVVIGTEFNSLEDDLRWLAFIRYVQTLYSGETAYAFNWDVFVHSPVEMPVNRIGVDAYPELDLPDSASVEEVAGAWHAWLDQRGTGSMPDVLLYEVGAVAESGLYRRPATRPREGAALNVQVQQRWFAATCLAAMNRELAGLYWWKVDFHLDPAAADPLRDEHDSFAGRPAEDVIRSCFAVWPKAAQ